MASPQPGATSGSGATFPIRDGERRGLLDKFWVLVALLLLALWSMLTGSVTLKRSAGGLVPGDSLDLVCMMISISWKLGRESVVTLMCEVYTHSKTVRFLRFWQDTFRVGYESLASDVPGIKDAAITEIARMSLRSSVSNDPTATRDMVSEPSLAQILSCYGLFQSQEFHDELISIPVSPSVQCCR